MDKTITMHETVYDLVTRWPEAMDIMIGLGFKDIAKPGMLQTAGRFMTLDKGIKLKKMDADTVRQAFEHRGFSVLT